MGCLNGSCTLWKRDALIKIFEKHSFQFEGDDLESTILAFEQRMNISFSNELVVRPSPKPNMVFVIKQRAKIWDYGLIRVLFSKANTLVHMKNRDGAFFRHTLINDILLHPLKILSLLVLLISLINPNIVTISVQITSIIVYSLIWALNIFSFAYTDEPFSKTSFYIVSASLYMFSPYLHIFIKSRPLAVILTYSYWFLLTGSLIMRSTENKTNKAILLLWAIASPIYYFLLLFTSRTYAFAKYFLKKQVPVELVKSQTRV
jgi:hypothetical protein